HNPRAEGMCDGDHLVPDDVKALRSCAAGEARRYSEL
ncbi:unnamed protein product, partial [Mycena citricolor]